MVRNDADGGSKPPGAANDGGGRISNFAFSESSDRSSKLRKATTWTVARSHPRGTKPALKTGVSRASAELIMRLNYKKQ